MCVFTLAMRIFYKWTLVKGLALECCMPKKLNNKQYCIFLIQDDSKKHFIKKGREKFPHIL